MRTLADRGTSVAVIGHCVQRFFCTVHVSLHLSLTGVKVRREVRIRMQMKILVERICRRGGTCTLSICLARTRSPITTCGYGILSRRQCEGCQVIIRGTCPRGNSRPLGANEHCTGSKKGSYLAGRAKHGQAEEVWKNVKKLIKDT